MSNRRKIKTTKPPRCADCHSTTRTSTASNGAAVLRVEHHPDCPAIRGITPSTIEAFAAAEAATGRTVFYWRDPIPPQE